VLTRLGRIPDVGDSVEEQGWTLTVLRRDRNRIAELRLRAGGRAPVAAAGAGSSSEGAGRGR
jgi:CBS domain containing-hemolysin-like protein